jgi:hypothetical protein
MHLLQVGQFSKVDGIECSRADAVGAGNGFNRHSYSLSTLRTVLILIGKSIKMLDKNCFYLADLLLQNLRILHQNKAQARTGLLWCRSPVRISAGGDGRLSADGANNRCLFRKIDPTKTH